MSLLKVDGLSAGYGKKNIINDIFIELSKGQMVGILGPNGCGKSTLLKALCKDIPYEGNVNICQQDVRNMSEKELAGLCSYVPQKSGLAIDISALDVVLMGFYPQLNLLERPSTAMKKIASELLAQVGIEIHANYMELSEGQKRMCILARSLANDAKLLLMDEPDASLDFGVRHQVMQIIMERVRENNTGVLLTLHDTNLALEYCEQIYLMKEGNIVNLIIPKEDSISDMEDKLQELYGPVRLLEYVNEKNTRQLVMVRA